MKCDELKATHIIMVYNGEIYEDFGTVPCTQLYYRKDEADAVIAEKDKVIAKLKEQYKDMDVTHTVHIAKMNAKIAQLEDDVAFWKAKAKGEM